MVPPFLISTVHYLMCTVLVDGKFTFCHAIFRGDLMSRNSRNSNRSRLRSRRDVFYSITNTPVLPRPSSYLREFEDRREYHPLQEQAPARSFSQSRHRLKVSHALPSNTRLGKLHYPSSRIAFVAPSRVLVCVRRKVRREVMHALGHSGKSGQRRPRRSEYSSIQC